MAGSWLGSPFEYYKPSDVSMTYTDFLQRKQLDEQLSFEITGPVKNLIESSSATGLRTIEVIERASQAQVGATYEVVYAVQDLQAATEAGFAMVGSILDWGFSEVALRIGRTNDLLTEIKNLLENPSLTWAYEQFNRARDRERRGHFAEALDSIDKAINGFGDELGESTEHRFHMLRGQLLLGSARNSNAEIINPLEAEKAFLLAAKYAEYDYSPEAGMALLYASNSAFITERYKESKAHAIKGLRFTKNAELYYQLARAHAALDEWDDAAPLLEKALELDKNLAVKIAANPVFRRKDGFTEAVLNNHNIKLKKIISSSVGTLEDDLRCIDNAIYYKSEVEGCDLDLSAASADVRRRLSGCVAALRGSKSIPDARVALESCWREIQIAQKLDLDLRTAIQTHLNQKYAVIDQEKAAHDWAVSNAAIKSRKFWDAAPWYAGIATVVFCLVNYLSSCAELARGSDVRIIDGFVGFVLGTPVLAAIVAAVATGIGKLATTPSDVRNPHEGTRSRLKHEIDQIEELHFLTPGSPLPAIVPIWARGPGHDRG